MILYELLVGKGPWHSSQSSLPSIMRRMLNEDPEMPSKATSAASPVPASAIAGDLDAIILKAMRRTAEERYSSVAALSDDVGRHLAMQPVLAREGSARYMAGRFIRRYRWAVGAAAAAIVAVLIGSGGIAWQARQTAIERDIALAEARRSESINRMLTVMFRETAASDAGEGATVKQMLDQTAQQLVNSVDTSARSATLITTLSDLYVNMEDSVAAETLLRAAMDKGIGKDDPVSMAQLRLRLASVAAALGKNDEMKPLLDAAEPVFRADPARYRYELVELNNARAQLLRRTGDAPGAIALLMANLPNAEIVYAENHRDLLTLYNNLLVYMVEANQLDAMPAVFRRADAAITRTGMQDSLQGLGIAQLKGMRLLRMDQPGEAAKIFEGLATKRRAIFGRSAGLAVEMLQLARARAAQGRYQDVRNILAEARPMAMEKLGPTALPTLVIGMTLAEAMAETGDTAGSARLLAELRAVVKPMPPVAPPVPMLARAEAVLALAEGRKATARDALGRAEAGFKGMGPAGETFLKALMPLRQRIDAMR